MIELYKSPVVFKEDKHEYWLGDKQLKGITSTLIHRAFPNKYSGIDPEVLANAAKKGHELHEMIEFHDSFGSNAEEHADPRIVNYERLKQENGLRTICNEYLVSDEENYASSIDIVMLNAADEICLTDTKTTWSLDRQSTGLQLSIYKRLFERQNPGLKVSHIYALWLPNKDTSIAELYELPFVSDAVIDALIKADLNDEAFDISIAYGSLPAMLNDVQDEVIRIVKQLSELKEMEETLKKGLYKQMEAVDLKTFEGTKIKLTRVLPSKSESFDSKRFKEEHPDLYKEYVKTSPRAGSLKITIL